MCNISTLTLKVIKETTGRYDLSKKITCPSDINNVLCEVLEPSAFTEEYLHLITVDNKLMVTGIFRVAQGTLNSCTIHPREIFKRAIMNNAYGIILTHNHPSGNTQASQEDINMTARIKEGARILGIELLDHIITGDNGQYISLKEKGVL